MTDQIPTPQVATMPMPPQAQQMPYPPQPGYGTAPVITQPEPERKQRGKLFWKKFGLRSKRFAALVIFSFVGKFIVDIFFKLGFRIERISTSLVSIGGIVIGIWFVVIVFKRVVGAEDEQATTPNTTYIVMNQGNGTTTVTPSNAMNLDQIPPQQPVPQPIQQPTQNPQ